ncbi:NUDIX hydrolase [Uliginosibacterium sp. sgz301328]|uniref:NUDIX hydrolase n=1 Tax=Uliginosibacterium sp. sgz301328 TaxID=3243764 RepID=UPI00359E06D4
MQDDLRAHVAQYLKLFPDETERVAPLRAQLTEDGDSILLRSNMHGHLTSSTLILNAAGTHVLLIHHRVFDRWLPPGGHYEAPGTPRESAWREVVEETGLPQSALAPHPLWPHETPLDIDTHPIPARPAKNEGAHRHHDLAFLAVADDSIALRPQEDEVAAARWVTLEEASTLPSRRMQRLLHKFQALIDAKRDTVCGGFQRRAT